MFKILNQNVFKVLTLQSQKIRCQTDNFLLEGLRSEYRIFNIILTTLDFFNISKY